MLLWSIQHKRAYEKMEQTGVLRADKNFIATDWFENSYLWMAEQMKKRIGEPPEGVIFPVWAWYQWEGMRKRPDMRVHGRNWGEKGTPVVLLTIEVPDNLVLLSDFDFFRRHPANGKRNHATHHHRGFYKVVLFNVRFIVIFLAV